MNLQWESENMRWAYYFHLDWEAFYIAFTIAGVDIQFHIHNVRSILYPKEVS